MISKIFNKIRNLVKISRIVSVDDSGDIRIGVGGFLGKQQQITVFSPYGLMSNPPENSVGITLQINGNESKMVGMFDKPDERPKKDLQPGEVAIGNYTSGDNMIFEDGNTVVVNISSGQNLKLESNGSGAKLTLGDGAKSVAVADDLQTLYTALKTKLDLFDAHTHLSASPGNPSGPPVPVIAAPSWDSNINSNKAKIPGN